MLSSCEWCEWDRPTVWKIRKIHRNDVIADGWFIFIFKIVGKEHRTLPWQLYRRYDKSIQSAMVISSPSPFVAMRVAQFSRVARIQLTVGAAAIVFTFAKKNMIFDVSRRQTDRQTERECIFSMETDGQRAFRQYRIVCRISRLSITTICALNKQWIRFDVFRTIAISQYMPSFGETDFQRIQRHNGFAYRNGRYLIAIFDKESQNQSQYVR